LTANFFFQKENEFKNILRYLVIVPTLPRIQQGILRVN
jgi:hypothetical protein